MKYAVIKTGGKQYKVTEGQVIEVEKLELEGQPVQPGSSFIFDEVLLFVDGDNVQIGAPTVEGMKVYADIVEEVKGEKIEVFKYKSKSRYRKHTGHRQKYTQVKINGIGSKKATVSPRSSKSVAGKAVEPEVVTKVAKPVTAKPAGRSVKKTPAKKPAAK